MAWSILYIVSWLRVLSVVELIAEKTYNGRIIPYLQFGP